MKNISWMLRLISSGIFAIVLVASPTAFADSDHKNLLKLQDRTNEFATELKNIQSRLRDSKPTQWELEALQSLIERASCLGDKHLDLGATSDRKLFTIALDQCFKRLEKIARSKDPERFIRKNIVTLRRLRDESLLELVKMNSSYIGNSVISEQLRILSASHEDKIADSEMRSLRYLIYKYPDSIQYGYRGYPCEARNESKIQGEPIQRIEFAGALRSILDIFNELISIGMLDKIDKNDLQIAIRLNKKFRGDLANYQGVGCGLESHLKVDLNAYLDTKTLEDLDYILK